MASNTLFTADGLWPPFLPAGKLDEKIEVAYYKGTETLSLACTQLPGKASRHKRIVKEWCDFFFKRLTKN